ncbi:MAG: tryptophan synthase subunit alpha, partial [Caulobacteraceae bacterium]
DDATPLVVMGYLNPLLTYGLAGFAADAADAGIDGLIIVDCPPEEAAPLAAALDRHGLALIRLATPTSDEARLRLLTAGARGFLYYVSVTGVTGGREVDAERIAPAVELARRIGGLPVAVGFGVRSPDQAAAVARVADAVVVGSALVDILAAATANGDDPVVGVLATAGDLARAVHAARGCVGS